MQKLNLGTQEIEKNRDMMQAEDHNNTSTRSQEIDTDQMAVNNKRTFKVSRK